MLECEPSVRNAASHSLTFDFGAIADREGEGVGGGRDRDTERDIANKSQTGRQRLTDTDLEGRIARQRQTD